MHDSLPATRKPAKVVIIGAGSASFGVKTIAAIMRSERLRGSRLALVDRNVESLGLVQRLVARELPIRQCPRLSFHLDECIKKGAETIQLIEETMAETHQRGPADPPDHDGVPPDLPSGHDA